MDVIYILKKGSMSGYQELVFSLRSLKNIDFDNIYIIGHRPSFINVEQIKADDPYPLKALNAWHKLQIACNDKRISDDFILMNDDFYILKPTELKYYYRGMLKDDLKEFKKKYGGSKYIDSMERTCAKFKNPKNYGLHCPFIYNKKKLLKLSEKYDMKKGYLIRSLYGNYYEVGGDLIEDYKLRYAPEVYGIENTDKIFLSSSDTTGAMELFRRLMLKKFPNECQYENR